MVSTRYEPIGLKKVCGQTPPMVRGLVQYSPSIAREAEKENWLVDTKTTGKSAIFLGARQEVQLSPMDQGDALNNRPRVSIYTQFERCGRSHELF